jgi:protoheme IX farnesyltransferase
MMPAATASRALAPADLWALTKPQITLMVLITTGGAMLLAGAHSLPRILLTLAGTALVVGGANTLNMYLERDIDQRMTRTRDRPLPAGRMAPGVALAFGLLLGGAAVPLLAFGVNPLTGALAAFSLVTYVWVYTPLKQRTPLALLIGAVPGAIPPLLGWTAARGAIETPGLVLFGILFFWQVPHFLAITLYRTDDYARAGFPVLAATRGAGAAKWRIVAYLAGLVGASVLLVPAGVAHGRYLAASLALGGALLAVGAAGLHPSAGRRWARRLFFATLVYLTLLFAALAVLRA